MKRLADLSASQMVTIDAAGVVIMASTFLAISAAHLNRGHGTLGFWFRTILSLLPLLLGGATSLWAHRQLEDGIASARWPDEEITSLRSRFETSLWRGFNIALAACIAMFAPESHHDLGWFLLTLGQGMLRLQYALRVKPGNTPPPDDWRNRPRLQSEHWGNP